MRPKYQTTKPSASPLFSDIQHSECISSMGKADRGIIWRKKNDKQRKGQYILRKHLYVASSSLCIKATMWQIGECKKERHRSFSFKLYWHVKQQLTVRKGLSSGFNFQLNSSILSAIGSQSTNISLRAKSEKPSYYIHIWNKSISFFIVFNNKN